jgi:hypothetical protein
VALSLTFTELSFGTGGRIGTDLDQPQTDAKALFVDIELIVFTFNLRIFRVFLLVNLEGDTDFCAVIMK